MAVVLKIENQGQLHRIQLSEKDLTYEGILGAIHDLYPNETLTARYLDEDKDLCTFCEASFSDFVSLASEHGGRKILRLSLSSSAGVVAQARSPSSVAAIKCFMNE